MAKVHVEAAIVVGARSQCHVLADEGFAHAELVTFDADAPAITHPSDEVDRAVLHRRQRSGHGPGTGFIAASWRLHADRLVRAARVVFVAPSGEMPLHVWQILEASALKDFGGQRAVEALILAIGLRMQRTAVAQSHA